MTCTLGMDKVDAPYRQLTPLKNPPILQKYARDIAASSSTSIYCFLKYNLCLCTNICGIGAHGLAFLWPFSIPFCFSPPTCPFSSMHFVCNAKSSSTLGERQVIAFGNKFSQFIA